VYNVKMKREIKFNFSYNAAE